MSPLTVALVLDTGDPSGFALADSSGISIAFDGAVIPVPAAIWLFGAALAGLIGFTEALMQEVRYDHIRVSYIMPGSVETEFANSPGRKSSPATWKLAAEDVAEAVINLLNSDLRSLSSRIEIRPSEPQKQ